MRREIEELLPVLRHPQFDRSRGEQIRLAMPKGMTYRKDIRIA